VIGALCDNAESIALSVRAELAEALYALLAQLAKHFFRNE
jgi:hypothetical protein